MIKIKLHGKLYLAGEYAIVYGRSPAILMQTSHALTIEAHLSKQGQLHSHKFEKGTINFDWNDFEEKFVNFKPIRQALSMSKRYILENGLSLKTLSITLESELENTENQKYGLGSSATITIGLIKVLCEMHDLKLDALSVYKLGVLAQYQEHALSSYGDLACIAFDSWIIYEKFDSTFLFENHKLPLETLLQLDWPSLSIQPIKPLKTPLLVIYTNQTADSHTLVNQISLYKDSSDFLAFCETSQSLLSTLIKNYNTLTFDQLKTAFSQLHQNLQMLQHLSHVKLITEDMSSIEDIVLSCDGSMKFSGAGGGDCVLAVFKDLMCLDQAKRLINACGYETFIL